MDSSSKNNIVSTNIINIVFKEEGENMVEYIRKIGGKYWHFCHNCSNYPGQRGVMCKVTTPSSEEVCEECKNIDRKNDCKEY